MEPILDATQMELPPTAYAGFWIRFGAAFIDGIILAVVQIPVALILFGGMMIKAEAVQNELKSVLYYYVIIGFLHMIYFSVMESSSYQATLGKRALGLKVVDLNGERIFLGHAIGRYLSKFPSAMILLIGYMMAGWTEKKQALHDMIAGTYVVK